LFLFLIQIDKVNQIVDACQPIATPTPVIPAPSTSESVITAAPALSRNEQCKIAILHPQMVDHQLDCTNVMNELRDIKADLYSYPLNQQRLNELDGMDYVIIVSEALDDSLLIEDDYLCRDKMPLDDIIDNIGGSCGHKGVIVITDKLLTASALSTIDEPVIVLPTFDKKVIKAATFQLFNKHSKAFTFYKHIQSVNTEHFKLTQLPQKNQTNIINSKTPLPSDISPTLLQHTIGRLDNIEVIVRKTIKLTDIAADGCLTIKGAGGLGKTTLAKKVVVALARDGRYRQGIYFIDASTIVDFTDFENKIMQPFGLEGAQDSLAELKKLYSAGHDINGTLSEQRLIVLDNAETLKHLADSERILCLLADICQFCTLLATSREVLGVEYGDAYELRQFSTDEAEALFYQQSPLKKLNEADRRILRHDILEQLLDNHPLAVKIIAKAAFRSDSVTTLRKKLVKSDELFEIENLEESYHPSDGNIERQRTVFKCIAYSYEQLKPEEQNIFKMLALFPDGLPSEQLQRISSEQKPNQQDERYQSIKKQYIKALQNKSLIEENNGVQKLHAIVRRFAEKKIEQAPNAVTLYKKAFKHNNALSLNFVLYRNENYKTLRVTNAKANSIQNNFISTIKYFGLYSEDVERQLLYIDRVISILYHCNCLEQQILALQGLPKSFIQDSTVSLYIQVKLLWLRYYQGEFATVYTQLQKKLSVEKTLILDFGDSTKRNLAIDVADIYKMEGNVIGSMKIRNLFYKTSGGFVVNTYPEELFLLGEIDLALLELAEPEFNLFKMHMVLDCLDTSKMLKYFYTLYEKNHINRMQVYYILSQYIEVDVDILDSLLVVNPYTAGLKQLMLLKLESNSEAVNKMYQQALENLFHIKYYYVEALLDYCRFLKTYDSEKYTEQLAIGLQLAEKHYYRFLQHQFIQLRDDTDEPYNANDYVLPDNLPLAEFKALVLKNFKSNMKKKA